MSNYVEQYWDIFGEVVRGTLYMEVLYGVGSKKVAHYLKRGRENTRFSNEC